MIIQMQVRRRQRKAGMHMFFSVPDGPNDLKSAWLRNCDNNLFNAVVACWVLPTEAQGTYICYRDDQKIGSISIRILTVHDATIPPSYQVAFDLECGLIWSNIFECRIEDLAARVQERINETVRCNVDAGDHIREAAAVFSAEPDGSGNWDQRDLMYAGTRIGVATIKRLT